MGASGSAIIADRGSLTMEANLESSTTSEHPDSQFQSIENDELIQVLAQELENLVISSKNDNQFFDRDIDKDEVDQNEVKRAIDDKIQVMEVKDDVFEAESSRENGAKKVLEDDLNECRVSEELIGDASEIGGQNYVNEVNDGVNEEYLKENYEIEIKNGDYSGEIRVYGWSDDGNEAGDLEHMTENAGGGENPGGDYSGEIGCYGWSDDGNEAGDVKHMTENAGGGEIGCYGWSDDEHMTENAGGDWSSENPGGDWGTSGGGGGGGLVNVVPYDDDDDGRMKSYQYSLRPDAEDCSYYIRTGMCKYGSNCKFNHPLKKRNQPNREIKKRREDNNHMERPGQIECKYYVTTGGCKYGKACKYNHGSRGKTVITPVLEYNFVGLPIRPGEKECPYYMCNGSCKYGSSCRFNHPDPTAVGEYDSHPPTTYGNDGHVPLQNTSQPIRPGEKECPYYMRNGSCKYGSSCRFNHPDPTAVGEYDSHPPTTYGNGGHVPLQNTSQPNMANMTNMPSWSAPRTPDPTAAFVPMMYAPTQNIPPPNSDWNGYQAPVPAAAHVYPSSERGLPIPPAYFLNPPGDTNVYAQHQQQQMLVSDYPERPGQPECSYFMKTGDCKYRSGCKFHHPKSCIARTTPSVLSDKGLPLRPDQNICSHYSRYGICKYGPACKYDHPVNYSHLAGEGGYR